MTEIHMSADSDLAGVLLAADPPFDLFLTLRDGDGKVRWSGSIQQLHNDHIELSVRTEPVGAAIDRSVEYYRATRELAFRQAGLL